MRKRFTGMAGGLCVLIFLSLSTVRADAPSFMGLGDLPGGTIVSSAYAVSPDGTIVVGRAESASGAEAFCWTQAGGMIGLGDLSGGNFSSIALDISADGSAIVGQGQSQSNGSAVRWEKDVLSDLGALTLNGYSEAWGVSADGSVVVGATQSPSAANDEAFRWSQVSGMVGLGYLAGGTNHSLAYAVSSNGSVIVGASGLQAFRWENDVMVGLGFLNDGFESEARDVSDDGSVIVGRSNTLPSGGTQAFRWVNGIMTGLGGLPGEPVGSSAKGVSADGSIVVGSAATTLPGGARAFIWDAGHGMRSVQDLLVNGFGLDLDGWFLQEVNDISADGMTLVGTARNPQGFSEGWIAHVPEPSSACLAFLILAIATNQRRVNHPQRVWNKPKVVSNGLFLLRISAL